MSLVILCRRVGVELSELILSIFFDILQMNKLTFLLRPFYHGFPFFNPDPNKVGLWGERRICVESSIRFPFNPLTKKLEAWHPVNKKNTSYSEFDLKFRDFFKSELGNDPYNQTKVFSIKNLLDKESRESVKSWRSQLGLEDNEVYPMWKLHPGQV